MVITRYLSAASGGLLITTGLLYLMQVLIDSGPDVITEPVVHQPIEWIKLHKDERVIVDETRHKRPKQPEPVPPAPRPDFSDATELHGGVNHGVTVPPRDTPTILPPGPADGPPMSLIKVAPVYPIRAAGMALEGFVTVSYDVLASGAVANVVVIESSHRLFDEAAVEAAYRFRYQPRFVNGIALDTYGLQNRFVFKMEN